MPWAGEGSNLRPADHASAPGLPALTDRERLSLNKRLTRFARSAICRAFRTVCRPGIDPAAAESWCCLATAARAQRH
jgi:hypothetical protein